VSDPPSQQPPPGGVIGLIDRALAFAAGGPWKAVFIIVLIIVGGGGYIIYEKRDKLFESWLSPSTPHLVETDVIQLKIGTLSAEIDVDAIQVWRVIGSNQEFVAVAARIKDDAKIPEPRTLPIMDPQSDPRNVASVFAGYPACLDIKNTGTALALRLETLGFIRGCAMAIPPDEGEVLGVMYLLWHAARSASGENVAVEAARKTARKLATH
jgi:uncharacterized membrane protein